MAKNEEESAELRWYVCESEGLGGVREKRRNSLKVGSVEPLLWYWEYVLVVVRWGCEGFGGLKVLICDLEYILRWYILESEGLSDYW